MYNLVHRIPHGLDNLKELLEEHIHSQGLKALDKCCDSAISVCIVIRSTLLSLRPPSFRTEVERELVYPLKVLGVNLSN